MPGDGVTGDRGSSDLGRLRADCSRCVGLCCVAPAFTASADFAIDKPAGRPCPNLGADFRCGIHAHLRERGFPGCTVYDCFGAGQQVTQVTFAGRDWRNDPHLAPRMFAVFGVVRQLHELLSYLHEAASRCPDEPLHGELCRAFDEISGCTGLGPDDLAALDVAAHRRRVGPLLSRASERVRGRPGPERSGAELIGTDLRGADLRGATLRGAYLIGADLRRADLRRADLAGADLRGADLRGADLRGAIFLTQPQLDAAMGDGATRLSAPLVRPPHWGPTRSL